MDFKITPTKNRKMHFTTVVWDFTPTNTPPSTYLDTNAVLPKDSVVTLAVHETVEEIQWTGFNLVTFHAGSVSFAGFIPNLVDTAGTIQVSKNYGDNPFTFGGTNPTGPNMSGRIKMYNYGTITGGKIRLTLGYYKDANYEYLNI